jgi:hypothetical protein
LFALGIGLILAAAAVYFADILPVYEVVLTIWMYATPIIYPVDAIPPEFCLGAEIKPDVLPDPDLQDSLSMMDSCPPHRSGLSRGLYLW